MPNHPRPRQPDGHMTESSERYPPLIFQGPRPERGRQRPATNGQTSRIEAHRIAELVQTAGTRHTVPHKEFPLEHASHPSRCPPLNMEFLWKLHHQRIASNTDLTNEERMKELKSQGFPVGIASLILQHSRDHPIRIWLVDNSGTMHQNDGHVLNLSNHGKVEAASCSRWQEVASTLQWHAELASWSQTPMVVRLLHDPGVQVGPQQVGVSASTHYSSNEEVVRLKELLRKTRPTGAIAPIHYHLHEIFPSIQRLSPLLEGSNKRIVLCVCTDSIPSDVDGVELLSLKEEFVATLKQSNDWPVQVVVRLSTDEERVVQFYRNLIYQEELPNGTPLVQILDDYVGECVQVQQHNPWLHYGYPLHLCREEGICIPVLEALSHRRLEPREVMEVAQFIFGELDEVETSRDYASLRDQIETWNANTELVWNPIRKKFVPWIDLKKLDKCYREASEGKCTVM